MALEEGAHSTLGEQFSHFVLQVCSAKRQEPIARRRCQSPGWVVGKGKSADSAVWAIRSALKESRQVWYCDHSRYLFNRARATTGGAQGSNDLRDFFQLEATDSFNNMAGKQMVYLLTERQVSICLNPVYSGLKVPQDSIVIHLWVVHTGGYAELPI